MINTFKNLKSIICFYAILVYCIIRRENYSFTKLLLLSICIKLPQTKKKSICIKLCTVKYIVM